MKHVTFTRDMAPHRAGEMRLVPDDVAAMLAARGEIAPNPPDFPARADAAPRGEQKPASRLGRRARDLLGQTYLTK